MIQGTASNVGKSLLVSALCTIFHDDGFRVAPFKSQNMSLNSYVDADGGEMGRAQVVQAMAAGIPPHSDMNPILLKPEADFRSQVIVEGRVWGRMGFGEYRSRRDELIGIVSGSLARLRAQHDVVVIEGAGSPAEINLNDGELVNMSIARMANAPVILVGDIDRGGVFAHLVGTLELLEPDERVRVRGVVINKFRGDATLLRPGLDWFEARTGVPVVGVMPYLHDLSIPDEDSVALEDRVGKASISLGDARLLGVASTTILDVAAIALPHVSNADDLDPLNREEGVRVRWVDRAVDLGSPDLIVIPGTKTTIAALEWLKSSGLAGRITDLVHPKNAGGVGTPIIGICGGFQILGDAVEDNHGVEAPAGMRITGLGLLGVTTTFARVKTTCLVRAQVRDPRGLLSGVRGAELTGYEIHMGHTIRTSTNNNPPVPHPFTIASREGRIPSDPDQTGEGCLDETGWILGTYMHGLFDTGQVRRAILTSVLRLRSETVGPPESWGTSSGIEGELDRLGNVARASLDISRIRKIAGF